MDLKTLQNQFKKTKTIYRALDGEVIPYNIRKTTIKGNTVLDVSEIDSDNTFSVAFSKPCSKWKPDYALPFISVMGVTSDKLILEKPKRCGGYDVPGRFFWIDGDFFLTVEAANKFVNHH